MCDFCRSTDGELLDPIISITKNPALPVSLTVWVWNKNKKGKLWFTVDVGQHTVIDNTIPIKNCPMCGRNLEVQYG